MNSNPETSALRFVVVGSGKTAIDVSRLLAKESRAELVGLVGDPRRETPQSSLAAEASALGAPYIETKSLSAADALAFMRDARPDYVISANNFMIFREEMLAIPRIATVNFHNGPLPAYAGLNPICWAIYNRETEYGIAWHLVDTGIDSGDILHVERFVLEPDATAVRTIIKVITAGLQSFRKSVLPRLLSHDLAPVIQDMSRRSYYAGKDKPFAGDLSWWQPGATLEPLSRALAFAPLRNSFYRPRLVLPDGGSLYCERFEYVPQPSGAKPGQILSVAPGSLTIASNDGSITAIDLFSSPRLNDMERIAPTALPAPGATLMRPEQAGK